jgi:purine-binding chemotaxis protein CheW
MEMQIVVFEVGDELFGVNISVVESIIKMQDITKIPHSLSFVEGVTSLRGSVLPVIDLRKRLNIDIHEITKETRIIVVSMDATKVGMIVDAVSEVLTIQDSVVEATPAIVSSSIDNTFITGIAKVEDRLIILLDLSEVLSIKEKKALEKSTQQALPIPA